MTAPIVRRIKIFPLSIPLRHRVEHAASTRSTAEPVVVAVELQNGVVGFGEALPRPYVTGETVDSVVAAVQSTFMPALLSFHPTLFSEALEAMDALPWRSENNAPAVAARAAVEIALLDASMRTFDRGMDAVVRFLDLRGLDRPGSLPALRFSGVLAAASLDRMRRTLRRMYWGGLRHFKLKVGFDGDVAMVRAVSRYLAGPIGRRRASLRVDANGAWALDEAQAWVRATGDAPISAVEQPLAKNADHSLPHLKNILRELRPDAAPLMIHDESLVTMADAERLVDLGVADAFAIRISKVGGMLPALRLASFARRRGIAIQVGCMVGETSILSAAQLQLLSVCPGVRWVEGCFGNFLLGADVVVRPLRFGFAGRAPRTHGAGLGVEVLPERLAQLSDTGPITLTL